MIEADAKAWIGDRYGPEKLTLISDYVDLLLAENAEQNLISRASEATVWTRHILDSAQILRFAPHAEDWMDVGSGPGLPGVVLAILSDRPILMIEPRRKRVQFLEDAIRRLQLKNAQVAHTSVERSPKRIFAAVTARAYAALPKILESIFPFTASSTVWVLPKGRSAQDELSAALQSWQGVFHVEHSLTDEDSRIVVATAVRPR